MKKTHEGYPTGPCKLPLVCSGYGTILSEDNIVNTPCIEECDVCLYCGTGKCPNCGNHWHCGGCI